VLIVTLNGNVKRTHGSLEGSYNIQGDIWVKQDGKGFIWGEGRVCERMSCKESNFFFTFTDIPQLRTEMFAPFADFST
jgi:hypothetical protein